MSLVFPPLMHGYELDKPGHDPFEVAKSKAIQGVEAGLVVYNLTHEALRATFIFTPEVSLTQAMIMLPICGIGFQNALGALAPPEVAVHLLWSGGVLINGARCGKLRVSANHQDPTKVPDWLCVGLELDLWPASENMGETPNETALYAEGCSEVDASTLLEAWARHTLNWLTRWEADGARTVHNEWRGLAHGIGEKQTYMKDSNAVFMGVDDNFDMLLRDEDGTTSNIPLTTLLEE